MTFSVTMEEQQRKKITKKRFEKSQYTVSTLKMNNINNNKLYIVICLRMEHLRVHKKSLKPVCAFQIELEFGSVKERGRLEYLGKTSWSKGENQEGTLPTYGVNIRIRTRATLVEDKCSHHCATLANDQWPKWISRHLGGGMGEEGHSSSLRGSPSGLFVLLVITRGLIIDWYISKLQKKGEHGIHLRDSIAKN